MTQILILTDNILIAGLNKNKGMIAELPFLSEICKKFHTAYDMSTISSFKLGMRMLVENPEFPIHFIMRPPVVQLQQQLLEKSSHLSQAQVCPRLSAIWDHQQTQWTTRLDVT